MTTSPAQRLFGRRTRTVLPITHHQLKPDGPADVGKQSGCQRTKSRSVLNSDHPKRDLRRLSVGETIRMQTLEHGRREWAEGTWPVHHYFALRRQVVRRRQPLPFRWMPSPYDRIDFGDNGVNGVNASV